MLDNPVFDGITFLQIPDFLAGEDIAHTSRKQLSDFDLQSGKYSIFLSIKNLENPSRVGIFGRKARGRKWNQQNGIDSQPPKGFFILPPVLLLDIGDYDGFPPFDDFLSDGEIEPIIIFATAEQAFLEEKGSQMLVISASKKWTIFLVKIWKRKASL